MTRRPTLGSLALLLLAACVDGPASDPARDLASNEPTFVGRETCAPCHEHATRQWEGSHHDLAMQATNDRTVLGDFDDATFTYAGVTSTFFRRGDDFFVRTDGPDGELSDYRVAYTFGATPLQQYLIEIEPGRLQALSICWDTRPAEQGGQRWFHLYPDEAIDHEDPLHWTGVYQNWNHMCAECHSTDLQKGYDPATRRYETTWAEIDVSCEACHGPGSGHVSWAKARSETETLPYDDPDMGLVVRIEDPGRGTWVINPETGNGLRLGEPRPTAEVITCARCHSRRGQIWHTYAFDRPLGDTHRLAVLDEGLYHPDGQIEEEVYVYGSWLQSKMHGKGVTCSDCHDPHSLNLLFPGDDVCARCHAQVKFDTPAHHFHKPETEGSHCAECHMPPKNYMVVDPRHDHSMRIPRPDLTVELGVPNACNDCHDDKSAEWAVQTVASWYGPDRRREPHWGTILEAARRRAPDAATGLATLAADPEAPAIARATALEMLGAHPGAASRRAVLDALGSDEPLLRRTAAAALAESPVEARLTHLAPLLGDPVRDVRLEATRALATLPGERLPPDLQARLERALGEFEAMQLVNADRPDGQLNLGWLYALEGRLEDARAAYRTAMDLDPAFVPAYVNLADVYRQTGRESEAERVLQAAIERAPESGEVQHALGLNLVRQRRLDEAVEAFERAVELSPETPRFAYVLAIALNDLGRSDTALQVLRDAAGRHPTDMEIQLALATIHRDRGELTTALRHARNLLELDPGNVGLQAFVAELEDATE